MGIARELAELEKKIRDRSIDLFAPIDRGGLLEAVEANAVLALMSTQGFGDPAKVMRLCLQALRVQHEEVALQHIKAELVATLPPEVPGLARPTTQVLLEMLKPPIDEIIVLGYEFTDLDIIRLLAEASSRGVSVIMICDRTRGNAKRIFESWPREVARPRLFQDKQRAESAPYASMHAKCLLVDGRDLLITSANFTFHGLHGNIEIGVRLSGAPVTEARKVFSHLVETGLVEEVLA